MSDEAVAEGASQPSAPKRDLTKAEVRQRQLANITHGGFVKAPAGLRQRDGRVRRALAHLRKLAPWLKPSDLPVARSYCEVEILTKDMFADIRANGRVYTDEQGSVRSRGDHRGVPEPEASIAGLRAGAGPYAGRPQAVQTQLRDGKSRH